MSSCSPLGTSEHWYPRLTARRVLWLSLAVVLVVYTVISVTSLYLFYDFHGSVQWAQELPGGGWNHPIYAVGYRLLLRGLYELVGDYAVAGKLISLIGAALLLCSAWGLGTVVSGNGWIGVGVLLLTAVNRTVLLWGTTPNTDLIAWAFGLAGLYVFLRARLEGGNHAWRAALSAGLLFGLGYIMRYSVVVAAAVAGFWLVGAFVRCPRWTGLANILAFGSGFLAIAAVQIVPSMLETGHPATAVLPKMFWMAYEWEATGVSYSILYPRYLAMPANDIYALLWQHKADLVLYYLGHIGTLLIRQAHRTWGPAIALAMYPAIAFVLWRVHPRGRRPLIYLLLTALAVVLFHGVVVFAPRYLLVTVPIVMLCLLMSLWGLLPSFSGWLLRRGWSARAVRALIALSIAIWLVANLFSEFRVLYLRENDRALYQSVSTLLRGAGVVSARQVGTVFPACAAYYDTGSPFKEVYDEILIQPDATSMELRNQMLADGRTYVVIDRCCAGLQPTLASSFSPTEPPAGFERVFAYPTQSPVVSVFRLSER